MASRIPSYSQTEAEWIGGGVFNIPKERPASPSLDQYSWEAATQPPKEWNEPEASMVVCVKQNNMSIFTILAETELRNPPKEIIIRVIDASCISLS